MTNQGGRAPERFDIVVVGSGFGGSVTAARAAQAGKSVLVLERGRSYPPNSFPRTPHEFQEAFWDPSERRFGLFDVWSFRHLDVVVSAGLGGGSLIYANVLLRKDAAWFVTEVDGERKPWPLDRHDLEAHYDAVEAVLTPQVFPTPPEGSPIPKVTAFERAATGAGFERTTYDGVDPGAKQWFRPPLAVTFANPGRPAVPGEKIVERQRNLHDMDRQTCRLCGDCDIGCNYGSKNTLDHTYLTIARDAGCRLETMAEVLRFEPEPGGVGYLVHYRHHPEPSERTVSAAHLVLAAGALGSTRLLLANRSSLVRPSPMLGHHFSGNGDLLAMALRARLTNGRGPAVIDASRGPVITTTLRSPDELDDGQPGARGYYLQDAGFPSQASWIAQTATASADAPQLAKLVARRMWHHFFARRVHAGSDLEALLSESSLASSSLPLLGMGMDTPDGVATLRDGDLELNWRPDRSKPLYQAMVRAAHLVAEQLSAKAHDDPLTDFFSKYITVHPLGGCPMGESPQEGVVDEWGRVHHNPRLHVSDGSVMPGPVGANPSLTIAALADRFADRMLEDMEVQ